MKPQIFLTDSGATPCALSKYKLSLSKLTVLIAGAMRKQVRDQNFLKTNGMYDWKDRINSQISMYAGVSPATVRTRFIITQTKCSSNLC